ncbi:MAG TPA: type II toxin-antitoxin system death-on-curing family toxin [Methylomirabilota bacterium]|nr:type II toxin-antitoxin system death-on-curing family toxin [Methylomirabilota bacterium]
MKTEPFWLDEITVLAFHEACLAAHGGAAGVRDHGMLLSALGRPKQLWHYEKGSLVDLAAAYAFGIAKNHPFIDGNKRTAFLTAAAFLELNGLRFKATEVDATIEMLALAAGERTQSQFAAWLAANSEQEA